MTATFVPAADPDRLVDAQDPVRASRVSRVAPYVAFFVTVFASMAAAAAVVSAEANLLAGLY
ncbi:MAG: hypothetical protein JWQ72_3720 [Polaromonas sp.]|nr:hypothetical protein [Polaromonas sp.]